MTNEEIYNLIDNNPGMTATEIAGKMGGRRNSSIFWAKLPVLETNGYLVYIDENNKIYSYRNLNNLDNERN